MYINTEEKYAKVGPIIHAHFYVKQTKQMQPKATKVIKIE